MPTNASNILAEYQPETEFAQETGISQKTSQRYRQLGLPYMLYGGKIYIHIPGAKQFLASRTRRANPPRAARSAGGGKAA